VDLDMDLILANAGFFRERQRDLISVDRLYRLVFPAIRLHRNRRYQCEQRDCKNRYQYSAECPFHKTILWFKIWPIILVTVDNQDGNMTC